MQIDLETGLMLLLILVSSAAVASYARYRMDVRVRLTDLQLRESLDEFNARLTQDRETLQDTERQIHAGIQAQQEQLQALGGRIDRQLAGLDERLSQLSREQQETLDVQTKRHDAHREGLQDLDDRVTQLRGEQQDGLQNLDNQLSVLRKDVEASRRDWNSSAEGAAAELKDLRTRLEAGEGSLAELGEEVWRNFDVDRVADVEQLAVIAGVMAADSLAALGRSEIANMPSPLHGHALMLYQILADFGADLIPEVERFHVLEIGTTREKWWGQMSTSRLALLCRALGLRMVSVDIDEESSASGRESTRMYGNVAVIHTEAGEDYLRRWEGDLPPYIYIDAYDYFHEEHSDHRMERYQTLQGEEINDPACWKMHLDCAEQFVAKCPSGGIVVFDDVFLEEGAWAGKGKDAVPFMLEGGFEIVGQTPHTLILRKA